MTRRRAKQKSEMQLTPQQEREAQLALTVLGGLVDWHKHCPIRSCRAAGECRAWHEKRLCTVPIVGPTELMLAAIVSYGKVVGNF
jgi:hypothetical protein